MAGKRVLEEDDCLSAADVSVKKGKHVLSEGMLAADEEDNSQVSCMQCTSLLHLQIVLSLRLPLFQTILSAFWQAGRLGLSFYEVESASLHFMPDSAEWEDFQLMSRGWQLAK